MEAKLQSVEYAPLHMRLIQWYLKQRWTHTTHRLRHPVFVNKDLVHSLLWWSDRHHLSQGMHVTFPNTTITIPPIASIEGWGSHCIVPGSDTVLFSELWRVDECQLHIYVLELRAVCLILLHLKQEVLGQAILIESDNMATVS